MAASADFKLTNYPLRRLAAQIPTLSSPCLRQKPTAEQEGVLSHSTNLSRRRDGGPQNDPLDLKGCVTNPQKIARHYGVYRDLR